MKLWRPLFAKNDLRFFCAVCSAVVGYYNGFLLESELGQGEANKRKDAGEFPSPAPFSILFSSQTNRLYIMPPMPGSPAGIGFSSSGMSVTRAAVVRIMAAMELAFSTALRVTLTGSERPASIMST